MNFSGRRLQFCGGFIALCLVATCGKAPPETVEEAAAAAAPAVTAPVAPVAVLPQSLSSIAGWSADMAGAAIADRFQAGTLFENCTGNIDAVSSDASVAERRIEGWSWNLANTTAFETVVVTNAEGAIIGAGETVIDRPDVPAAIPQSVATSKVGFVAFAPQPSGAIKIYGIDQGGSYCLIGASG